MRNVGPGAPGVFLRQPGPRGLSEEPGTACPVSCHPAPCVSCCCPHRALTHWGTPPSAHPLSEGSGGLAAALRAIPLAPRCPTLQEGCARPPAVSVSGQGSTVADLRDGREGSLACDGQRLKMAPAVGLEAGGGGGRRQGPGSFLLEEPPDEEEQMGSNILPSSDSVY